jgi:hypothetical protein
MPAQPPNSPLGAFLAALRQAQIDCILIGNMAAIRQGAPLMTVDYDFWVRLPERQYTRLLTIIQRQGGAIPARTLYELSDGTQVNAIFNPDGLRSFEIEFKGSPVARLEGQLVRVLPLARVIASKRAAARDKDLAVMPILERTERLRRRLVSRRRFAAGKTHLGATGSGRRCRR